MQKFTRTLALFLLFFCIILQTSNTQAQELNSSDSSFKIIIENNRLSVDGETKSSSQDGSLILSGALEIFESGESTSGDLKIKSGIQPTYEANVSTVSQLSSLDEAEELFDSMIFEINPQNNNTTAGGTEFAVQISLGTVFNEANFKYINPIGFQPDLATDINLNSYYRPCAQSASDSQDQTRWDCGNTVGLKKYIYGLQPGTTYCARIVAKNGDFSNSQPGPATCATTQISTLCFAISASSSTFGTIPLEQVKTADPVTIISAQSSTPNGYTVTVRGNGNGMEDFSGLHADDVNYLIKSKSANLDQITEDGYGIQATIRNNASGGLLIDSRWTSGLTGRSSEYVGQVSRDTTILFSSNTPTTSSNCGTYDSINVLYKVKISESTPVSSNYQDTLTYSMTVVP